MNHRMILRLVCYILRVGAICMLPALVISLFCQEWSAIMGLCAAVVLSALLSLITFLLPPRTREIGAQEGFLSVALCWIAVSKRSSLL